MPTKTTSPLFSSLAARDTISSLVVYSGIVFLRAAAASLCSARASSEPVVDRLAHLPVGLERRAPVPHLLRVRGAVGHAVHPLVEVLLQSGVVLRDRVPLHVEVVVPVVRPLDERRVGAERLGHD